MIMTDTLTPILTAKKRRKLLALKITLGVCSVALVLATPAILTFFQDSSAKNQLMAVNEAEFTHFEANYDTRPNYKLTNREGLKENFFEIGGDKPLFVAPDNMCVGVMGRTTPDIQPVIEERNGVEYGPELVTAIQSPSGKIFYTVHSIAEAANDPNRTVSTDANPMGVNIKELKEGTLCGFVPGVQGSNNGAVLKEDDFPQNWVIEDPILKNRITEVLRKYSLTYADARQLTNNSPIFTDDLHGLKTAAGLEAAVNVTKIGDVYLDDLADNRGFENITTVDGLYAQNNRIKGELNLEEMFPSLTKATFIDISNNDHLVTIDGGDTITEVTSFNATRNNNLTEIKGFNKVKTLTIFTLLSNTKLVELAAFQNTTNITSVYGTTSGDVLISGNGFLDTDTILPNLEDVVGSYDIVAEDLVEITGPAKLKRITGDLTINKTDNLTNINGFGSLTEIQGSLEISADSTTTPLKINGFEKLQYINKSAAPDSTETHMDVVYSELGSQTFRNVYTTPNINISLDKYTPGETLTRTTHKGSDLMEELLKDEG
jgi:hypothetical protein